MDFVNNSKRTADQEEGQEGPSSRWLEEGCYSQKVADQMDRDCMKTTKLSQVKPSRETESFVEAAEVSQSCLRAHRKSCSKSSQKPN